MFVCVFKKKHSFNQGQPGWAMKTWHKYKIVRRATGRNINFPHTKNPTKSKPLKTRWHFKKKEKKALRQTSLMNLLQNLGTETECEESISCLQALKVWGQFIRRNYESKTTTLQWYHAKTSLKEDKHPVLGTKAIISWECKEITYR